MVVERPLQTAIDENLEEGYKFETTSSFPRNQGNDASGKVIAAVPSESTDGKEEQPGTSAKDDESATEAAPPSPIKVKAELDALRNRGLASQFREEIWEGPPSPSPRSVPSKPPLILHRNLETSAESNHGKNQSETKIQLPGKTSEISAVTGGTISQNPFVAMDRASTASAFSSSKNDNDCISIVTNFSYKNYERELVLGDTSQEDELDYSVMEISYGSRSNSPGTCPSFAPSAMPRSVMSRESSYGGMSLNPETTTMNTMGNSRNNIQGTTPRSRGSSRYRGVPIDTILLGEAPNNPGLLSSVLGFDDVTPAASVADSVEKKPEDEQDPEQPIDIQPPLRLESEDSGSPSKRRRWMIIMLALTGIAAVAAGMPFLVEVYQNADEHAGRGLPMSLILENLLNTTVGNQTEDGNLTQGLETTASPTALPTRPPSEAPSTSSPTATAHPTHSPTVSTAPTLSLSPSFSPSKSPSQTPTAYPSLSPSQGPTIQPTSSLRPTLSSYVPDVVATVTQRSKLENETTPQAKALEWILRERYVSFDFSDEKILQRYALLAIDFSLNPNSSIPVFANSSLDECEWYGVTCAPARVENITHSNATDSNVTEVQPIVHEFRPVISLIWARYNLTGTIPNEIHVLSQLKHLDLGENEIHSTIPDALYTLTDLEYLYLHQNKFTGSISEKIGNLYKLKNLYLGNNNLSGPFPDQLASRGNRPRPLRKF